MAASTSTGWDVQGQGCQRGRDTIPRCVRSGSEAPSYTGSVLDVEMATLDKQAKGILLHLP
jgi:hypothetical protein